MPVTLQAQKFERGDGCKQGEYNESALSVDISANVKFVSITKTAAVGVQRVVNAQILAQGDSVSMRDGQDGVSPEYEIPMRDGALIASRTFAGEQVLSKFHYRHYGTSNFANSGSSVGCSIYTVAAP